MGSTPAGRTAAQPRSPRRAAAELPARLAPAARPDRDGRQRRDDPGLAGGQAGARGRGARPDGRRCRAPADHRDARPRRTRPRWGRLPSACGRRGLRRWTKRTSRTRPGPSAWRARSCCRHQAPWRARVRGPFLPRCSFDRPAVRARVTSLPAGRDHGWVLIERSSLSRPASLSTSCGAASRTGRRRWRRPSRLPRALRCRGPPVTSLPLPDFRPIRNRRGGPIPRTGSGRRGTEPLQVAPDLPQLERTRYPQGPRELLSPLREIETGVIRMHVRTPTTHAATSIRQELAAVHDDTQ